MGMPPLKQLLLATPRQTLAVAESLTCGRVQSLLGATSGASDFFLGGITVYTLEQKARHLGLELSLLKSCNGVSETVAEGMALGACTLFGADLGLATTGYAEAAPEKGIDYPYAWWGLAQILGEGRAAVLSGRVECPGRERVAVQEIVASVALKALERFLREQRTC